MQADIELTELSQMTRTLAGQPTFRSKALLITRLLPLILAAIEAGHTHNAIYETIVNAGLPMTFTVYRQTLHRVRTRKGATTKLALRPQSPAAVETGSQEPTPEASTSISSGSQEPKPETEAQPQTEFRAGDAFAVRNALKEAQAVSQKYRKSSNRKP